MVSHTSFCFLGICKPHHFCLLLTGYYNTNNLLTSIHDCVWDTAVRNWLLLFADKIYSQIQLTAYSVKSFEKALYQKEFLTFFHKVVVRRLPPSLTKEQLEEQLAPLPEHDYFEFFPLIQAYINFKNQEDIVLFRDQFDGYVFIDNKGQEYPAIVEFAPFQKIPKKKSKKKDAKAGTIEDAAEQIHFSDGMAFILIVMPWYTLILF
uniref:UPF3 domain-containing protein n=1 Tax=Callorhinchus milii TaxID=7868 RepID=A0A4W3J243_CALMI